MRHGICTVPHCIFIPMKKNNLIFLCLFISLGLQAQDGKILPSVIVKDLTGKQVSSSTFTNEGKPVVISFWATWCKPCILELSTIHDEYKDWVAETGVKVIAVSIDDVRNSQKVQPFVNGKGWEYDVFLDENGDLKRAMGVNNVPHTFLLNGKGEIVYQHNSYSPGDEEELLEKIKEIKD